MQTNRGVALSDRRCAPARTRFTPLQRFAKEKLCLSIKAFYAFANLCGAVRRRANCTAAPWASARPRERGDPIWIPACAEISERSSDCATRNPGLTARLSPAFVHSIRVAPASNGWIPITPVGGRHRRDREETGRIHFLSRKHNCSSTRMMGSQSLYQLLAK